MMKIIKKGTPDEIVSVIRQLQEKIQSLEDTLRASKADYSELIDVLKPAFHDLVNARDGQRVAREKQLSQPNGFHLLEATGALKGMRKKYGGKEDSEMARILELVIGYNQEGYRKMLGQNEGTLSSIDKASSLDEKRQLVEYLKQHKCKKTADIISKTTK